MGVMVVAGRLWRRCQFEADVELAELVEGVSFQSGEAVGFPMQETPFRGRHRNSVCEARSDAPLLRVPESSAGTCGGVSFTLRLVSFVEGKDGVAFDELQVEEAAGGDDGADSESEGDLLIRVFLIADGRPEGPQLFCGNEEFGGGPVAELLGCVICRHQLVESGQTGFTDKQVCQFVSQGEGLGGDVVGTVDENKGGVLVHKGESEKLFRIEFATVAVADDAVEDDEDAGLVDPVAEEIKRLAPTPLVFGPTCVEAEGVAHGRGDCGVVVAVAVGADEGEGVFFVFDEVVAHPGLAALHLIDGVEQIGAWAPWRVAGARAEIVDREAVVGGLFQVEVAEGSVGSGGESICLGDADFAGLFPLGDTVRFDVQFLGQRFRGKVGAFARPAEYAGLECDLEASGGGGLGHGWIGD